GEDVVSGAAIEVIVTGAADEKVIAGTADELDGRQGAVEFLGPELIVSGQALHPDGYRVGKGRHAAVDGDGSAVHQNEAVGIGADGDDIVAAVTAHVKDTVTRAEHGVNGGRSAGARRRRGRGRGGGEDCGGQKESWCPCMGAGLR